MARKCFFDSVTPSHTGNHIRYRGRPKYLGGIGLKMTSCAPRTFRANLQAVNAVIDGSRQKILVSTKMLKKGLVVKSLRRKYTWTRQQKAGGDPA